MILLGDDSFSFRAMRPAGLDEVMEVVARVLEPYLPGLDAEQHVAALLAVEAGFIQITIEARTEAGRAALHRLAQGDNT